MRDAGVLRRCAVCGDLCETHFEVQPEVFVCDECKKEEENDAE